MKQRPILFQGAMVRALLDGRKTQTRRIGKIQSPDFVGLRAESVRHASLGHQIQATHDAFPGRGTARHAICACPYGQPGDQLLVRESHWYFKDEHDPVTGYFPPSLTLDDFEYRADGESDLHGWFPSIHMPRIGSRITLEITGVRVERLQDISEADAQAEGVDACDGLLDTDEICRFAASMRCSPEDCKPWYAALWESINGRGSWDANPWVWCLSFKRVPQC